MPPPPPPKYDEEAGGAQDGGTSTNGNENENDNTQQEMQAQQQQQEQGAGGEKDEALGEKLNGENKIYRQYMLGLMIMFVFMTWQWVKILNSIWSQALYVDLTDFTNDTAESSNEAELGYEYMFTFSFLCIMIGIVCAAYHYYHLSGSDGGNGHGSLSFIHDICDCNESKAKNLWFVAVGAYVIGIGLFIGGAIMLLDYYFWNEDYSQFYKHDGDTTDDEYFFGYFMYILAPLVIVLCYMIAIFLQHLKAEQFLNVIESRVFLFSLPVWLGASLQSTFYSNDKNYENSSFYYSGTNDDFVDSYESNFGAARIIAALVALTALIIVIVSGIDMSKVNKGGESEIAVPSNTKKYVYLALFLLLFMICYTCVSALTRIDMVMLWLGTIMVCSDVLC